MSKLCEVAVNIYQVYYYIQDKEKKIQQMNLSPSRASNQPALTTNCMNKPRIAFTYQMSNTPSSQCHQNVNMMKLVNEPIAKGNPQNILTQDMTPHKTQDKQNIKKPLIKENKEMTNMMSSMKKGQNFCYKSNITNFHPFHNNLHVNCSPINSKLPPLSPKTNVKKNHKRCPSFLSQKNGALEQSVGCFGQSQPNETSVDKININLVCCCGKPVTHKYGKNQGCCSKCGINKMLQGHQLQKLAVKPFPSSPTSQIINRPVHLSPTTFLQTLETQKQSLTTQYKQLLQTKEQQSITQFYKDKKQELKIHYQKIKTAIKQSIDQDLKFLENVQKQHIANWKKSIGTVQENIKKLEMLEVSVKNTDQNNVVKESTLEEFNEIIKNKIAPKLNKVLQTQETLNISTISNTQSLILSPSGLQKYTNGELYKSQMYRMMGINKTERSQRSFSLFSCSNINSTQQCLSPTNQLKEAKEDGKKGQSGKVEMQIGRKNVLFSFQGNK